jgi:hypothetical protein
MHVHILSRSLMFLVNALLVGLLYIPVFLLEKGFRWIWSEACPPVLQETAKVSALLSAIVAAMPVLAVCVLVAPALLAVVAGVIHMSSSILYVIVGPLLVFSELAQHALMLICGSSIATALAALSIFMALVEFFGAFFILLLLAMLALLVCSLLFVTAGCLAALGAWYAPVHEVRSGRGQHAAACSCVIAVNLRLSWCALKASAFARSLVNDTIAAALKL